MKNDEILIIQNYKKSVYKVNSKVIYFRPKNKKFPILSLPRRRIGSVNQLELDFKANCLEYTFFILNIRPFYSGTASEKKIKLKKSLSLLDYGDDTLFDQLFFNVMGNRIADVFQRHEKSR